MCWKCGKEGHYKRDCKSKAPKKEKGSDDAPSIKAKTTSDEGGDVYLDSSSSTHVDNEAWLIDSGASFHFTPQREWFCEYEKCDGGDIFLGDDSKARIIFHGKFKLKFQGGRIRTLPGVLHIPALPRNLFYVSKLDDACVKNVFKKDTYKMVWGALVLMQGSKFWNRVTRKVVYKPQELAQSVKSSASPMGGHRVESRKLLGTVKEAIDSKDGKLWKEAMFDEMASLHKNEAWDLVDFPTRRKPIGNKWVFKKKANAEGKVEKYKARLVGKGYSQVPGIDFGDIFSVVAKVASIRLLVYVATTFDFEV
eukprot:PITA_36366